MSKLARRLGFFSLAAYGIGDTLGAGIYTVVGKVVGEAGSGAWVSFLLAGAVALFTGFSYAELSSRFPVSSGAAGFVSRAIPGPLVAILAGVFVLGTGLSSAATVISAFGGYLQELVSFPAVLSQVLLIAALSFLSFWGILESSRVNVVLTAIEFSGLVAVIVAGIFILSGDVAPAGEFLAKSRESFDLFKTLGGITIAFFAYIGFEDISNLAEEAKNPKRDVPRAILVSVIVSTVMYVLVVLTLQLNVPESTIPSSETPLLLVFQKAGWDWFLNLFSVIAIFAIANTGLANLIMASRLLYGMSEEGLIPKFISKVHAKRKTPWVGVVIAGTAVVLLTFTGDLKILAQTTSLLIMIAFLMVHVSLVLIKRRKTKEKGMRFPFFFPIIGGLLCLGLISQFPWEAFARGSILLGIGFLVWGFQKWCSPTKLKP